ncbi:MAG: hypothetical protein WCO78_02630 [Candidatus Roizmanbacteria bacterium]
MTPLLLYVLACVFFTLLIRYAVGNSRGSDTLLMIGIFTFGGVIGWHFEAYELGFIFAAITNLLLW